MRSRRRSCSPQATKASAPAPAHRYTPTVFHAYASVELLPLPARENVLIINTQIAAIALTHAARLRSSTASASGPPMAISQPVVTSGEERRWRDSHHHQFS